jgi:hypothetical protein
MPLQDPFKHCFVGSRDKMRVTEKGLYQWGQKLEIQNAEWVLCLTAGLGMWHGHSNCQDTYKDKGKV